MERILRRVRDAPVTGEEWLHRDLIHLPSREHDAVAIRAFDAVKQSWAIWWLSAPRPNHLDTPVIGRFADGIGTF